MLCCFLFSSKFVNGISQNFILDPNSTNIELGRDIGPVHFHTKFEATQSIHSKDIDRASSKCQLFKSLTSVTLKNRSNPKPRQNVQDCGEMHPCTKFGVLAIRVQEI
jgi:hypothetical protein